MFYTTKKLNAWLFILLATGYISAFSPSWNKKATYLFAPGLWSSEHQAAKYCTEYTASTGERITSSHGFEVIQGNTTISCNFPEIVLRRLYKTNEVYFYMIPKIVASSLLARLGNYILDTSNNHYQIIISGRSTHNLSINPYFLNIFNLNFGQQLDIQVLKKTYEEIIQNSELPNDIVLYGVSRGAVAAFNFIAKYYEALEQKRIRAIVLESCFDSLANMTNLSSLLSLILPHYEHLGIAPINSAILKSFVDICNKYSIPVLFISSLCDNRVPYKNTYNLYQALKKAGLNHIHFITLEQSLHSGYSHDDHLDTKHYLKGIHNFYKMYDLPYNTVFLE